MYVCIYVYILFSPAAAGDSVQVRRSCAAARPSPLPRRFPTVVAHALGSPIRSPPWLRSRVGFPLG